MEQELTCCCRLCEASNYKATAKLIAITSDKSRFYIDMDSGVEDQSSHIFTFSKEDCLTLAMWALTSARN